MSEGGQVSQKADGAAKERVVVANAPVSFGAFEITVGIDPNVPDGLSVLDQVAAAGYRGIDLGPAGYLGEGSVLRQRLTERKLGLAGGYLELPYSEPALMPKALHELDVLLDVFDAAGVLPGALKPRRDIAASISARPATSAREACCASG